MARPRTPADLRRTDRALVQLAGKIGIAGIPSVGGGTGSGSGGSTSTSASRWTTLTPGTDYTAALPRYTITDVSYVSNEMWVTLDMSGRYRPSHGLRSKTHVTISGILPSTHHANGTFTIDSLTHDIINKTEGTGGKILIETFFPHGYTDSDTVRIESLEKGIYDESEGTWTITVPSTTTFQLETNVWTGATSEFVTEYEGRGGICSLATKFKLIEDDKAWNGRRAYAVGGIVVVALVRYVCILAHTNKKPPNGTYWTVVAQVAYTSGGTLIVPGLITINSPNTPALTPVSTATERQAAISLAATRGFGLGLPIRMMTATQTLYGIIVGVPGEEGFPYTDPAPLPFYLDNELAYAGPRLTEDLTALAIGTQDMVFYDRMLLNALPFYGSECELPINPLSYTSPTKFKTTGGGNSYGTYGKAYFRFDRPSARVVALAMQQDTAGVYGDWGTLSGGTVAVVPDCRRPGVWTNGVPIDTTAWSTTQTYFVGEIVKASDLVLYICTVAHNIDGDAARSQDPATNNSDDGTNFWRSLHKSTLTWSAVTYVRGDIVVDGGALYLCTLGHSTSQQPSVGTNVPTYWRAYELTIAPPTWSAGTYATGNVVEKGHVNYIAAKSTSKDPSGTAEWASGTVYIIGDSVTVASSSYACSTGHTANADSKPGSGDDWETYWTLEWSLASRETYEDGSASPGSRVTRNSNANFSPGHPDSGLIGWTFVYDGITTYVRDRVRLPPKIISTITNDLPALVTTTTDHELLSYQTILITGTSVPEINNVEWEIIKTSDTEFKLRSSEVFSSYSATGGLITGYSYRMFIVEDGDLTETTSASYSTSDFPLQPKINLDIGGQLLSTNDNNTGVRTNRNDNLATWNPPNEINSGVYDVIYNSRAGVASTGVGNQPGIRTADEDELTTYTEGTIAIQYGVVTLTAGYFPTWASRGEIIVEGDSAVLTVTTLTGNTWAVGTTYSVGTIVSSGGSIYKCILANTGNVPPNPTYWIVHTMYSGQILETDGTVYKVTAVTTTTSPPGAAWESLGLASPTTADPTGGYSTHLQLSNVTYNAPAGSKYVLRPEGEAAKWLTVFLTCVQT